MPSPTKKQENRGGPGPDGTPFHSLSPLLLLLPLILLIRQLKCWHHYSRQHARLAPHGPWDKVQTL